MLTTLLYFALYRIHAVRPPSSTQSKYLNPLFMEILLYATYHVTNCAIIPISLLIVAHFRKISIVYYAILYQGLMIAYSFFKIGYN